MPAHRTCAVFVSLLASLTLLSSQRAAGQNASIGLYTDETGSSCSFSGNSPGYFVAYVVVRPGTAGVRSVNFAAQLPSCLGASWLGETAPFGATVVGNTQNGVSITFNDCIAQPTYALQVFYTRTGSTATCCEFKSSADPSTGTIAGTDCAQNAITPAPITSHFNADATCPCLNGAPPYPPSDPSPADFATLVDAGTPLSWLQSSNDNDITELRVYLGTTTSPPLVATVGQPSYQPPVALLEAKQYYWRVVARDLEGYETSGPLWTFVTLGGNSPPDFPRNLNPADGATNVSLKPTLDWDCTDADGDPITYDVSFGTTDPLPLVYSGLESQYTPAVALLNTTLYRWRVVARDTAGNSTSSPELAFTTTAVNLVPRIRALAPQDNALNVPLDQDLGWTDANPDGEQLTFDVWLWRVFSSLKLVASGITATTFDPGPLSSGARYNWRIVAHEPGGRTTTSQTFYFATTGNQPPALTYLGPGNGSTVSSLDVMMTWSMVDPEGEDPLYADFYLGTEEPLTYHEPCTGCGFYKAFGLAYNTTYYWRVVAYDPLGGITTGPTWSFKTFGVNHPPNTPSNPLPANGATNVGIMPLLAWSTSDPDSGQDVNSDIYFGSTANPPYAGNMGTLLFTLAFDPLSPNSQYFWKIVAKDAFGGETPGPVWSFRTGSATTSQPPTVPSNPDPSDGSVVHSQFVNLQWTCTDPENNPLTYVVSKRLCYCVGNSTFAGVTTSPSFTMGPLVPGRTYYWSVNSYDGFGGSTGPVWSFIAGEPAVPVLFSRFDASLSGGAARIEWELQSDESMAGYTLLRRTPGASGFLSIATGAVSKTRDSYLDRTVEPGRAYEYQLLVSTAGGDEFRSQPATVTMPAAELALGACHPNPFNPQTTIPYSVPATGVPVRVRLIVYDTAGRLVRVLVDGEQPGGARDVVWKGDDASGHVVSSGIYFCVLQAGKERRTQKMVLLK